MNATIKNLVVACLTLSSFSAFAADVPCKRGELDLRSGAVYQCGPQGWMPVADGTVVQAQIIFTIENAGKSVEVPMVLMRGRSALYSTTSEMSYVAKAETTASGVIVTTAPLSTGITVHAELTGFDERGNALVEFTVKQSSLDSLATVKIGDVAVQTPGIAGNDVSQTVALDISGTRQALFANNAGFRVYASIHNILRAGEVTRPTHG